MFNTKSWLQRIDFMTQQNDFAAKRPFKTKTDQATQWKRYLKQIPEKDPNFIL